MDKFSQEDKLYELVTFEDDLKCLPENTPCKEFIKEKTVTIPKVKPKIEQLSKIIIKPMVTSYKRISTLEGPKLLIQGKIVEKVFYVADNTEQTVHAAKFSFPFCNFIKLVKKRRIEEIKVNVEDILVKLKCGKKLEQCILLIICAIPKKKCRPRC